MQSDFTVLVRQHDGDGGLRVVDVERAAGGDQLDQFGGAVWSKAPIINAKVETLQEKPTFKKVVETQRCLVPADGFYEWQVDGVKKRPMRIHLESDEPFCFAGLWGLPTKDAPEAPGSFLIITTAANDFMTPIHSRMPMILRPEEYDAWLDTDGDQYRGVLNSPCRQTLSAYEVSPLVNNARNENPACLRPADRALL